MRIAHAFVLAGILIGLATSVAAETAGSASNVRITVEVGGLQAGKKVSPKTYTLLAPLRGSTTLNSGARVAIPAPAPQSAPAEGKDAPPTSAVTSYTYQNLGILISLETTPGEGRRIQVRGSIDVSLIRSDAGGKTGSAPPTIGTFNQRIDVTLQDGKPARLAVVDEPGTEPFYVDMKAELVE